LRKIVQDWGSRWSLLNLEEAAVRCERRVQEVVVVATEKDKKKRVRHWQQVMYPSQVMINTTIKMSQRTFLAFVWATR
jgi:hypothetical protein